jgi:very-short-patch-repair endonuclease
MNFGPLNREGGGRRLNVAVTRARYGIKILASFHPHDIDRGRTKATGVHLLRSYLGFADQGPKALLGAITAEGGDFGSPFEAAVAEALGQRGLRVVSQVGVGAFRIDLGIKDDAADRYLLGIECDGATYHSSRTARDRDRLRQQVLEGLGWTIHRIWSTDWLKDPAGETEKVLAAVEAARVGHADGPLPSNGRAPASGEEELWLPPDGTPGVGALEADAVHQINGVLEAATAFESAEPAEPIAGVYERVALPRGGGAQHFLDAPAGHLAGLIKRCVEVEGPVHVDRAFRAVAASYGYGRVGGQIRGRLQAAVRSLERAGEAQVRGDFLWPTGLATPPVRAADADGNVRPIDEVAPEEIAAAATAVLRAAFSINRGDLVVAVARELGYDRTGANVAAVIGDVVGGLLGSGAFAEVGGQVSLAAITADA